MSLILFRFVWDSFFFDNGLWFDDLGVLVTVFVLLFLFRSFSMILSIFNLSF